MKDINEKNILDIIKKSVEEETPDVWEKVKTSESCKYELQERPLKMKKQNMYRAGAAVAACLLIAVIGFSTKIINFSGSNAENSGAKGSQANDMIAVAPGIQPAVPGRNSGSSAPEMMRLYTKDADLSEASKALNFEIAAPSWLPEGFTKVSAQLVSNNEDNSMPYMYVMKWSGQSKEELTVNITKYMSGEEKLKLQPSPMPAPGIQEGNGEKGNDAVPPTAGSKAVPPLPPEDKPQSVPGYNPSEGASSPPVTVVPISPGDGKDGANDSTAVSSGTASTSSAWAVVSVSAANTTVNGTDVQMYITSSGSYKTAVSAYWVYNGGSYSISASGISQDDMEKIIESMIK